MLTELLPHVCPKGEELEKLRARGMLSDERRDANLPLLKAVKAIADEKDIGLSQLALVKCN